MYDWVKTNWCVCVSVCDVCTRVRYRLSKELQQKDKIIESLRTKLNQPHQHHPHQRSDTPCSGHALSDATDQSDRISYVSDEHGSTNEDLDPCSDVDAASELGQKESRTFTRAGEMDVVLLEWEVITTITQHMSFSTTVSSPWCPKTAGPCSVVGDYFSAGD